MLVPTNSLLASILAAAQEHVVAGNFTGPLYQPYVALFTGAFTPSQTLTLSGLTEATYSGYARIQITSFSPDYISEDGNPAVNSETPLFFQPTSPVTVENVITGWGLVSAGSGGTLLASETFETPVPLQTVNDALDLVAKLEMSGASGLGFGIVVN